jgi:DNA modification methylase
VKLYTYSDYLDYAQRVGYVEVAGKRFELSPVKVKRLEPLPDELGDTSTTVWSFPKRGKWATHGNYRGNWAPQIPRALIQRYSPPSGLVVDPTVGGGTSCIEAKLLGRKCIGVDINLGAVMLTLHRLYWLDKHLNSSPEARVYLGDARRLELIDDESADLVLMHPPYYKAVRYGKDIEGDMSNASSVSEFTAMLAGALDEALRVLKPSGYLAVMLGDVRIAGEYVPLSLSVPYLISRRKDAVLREEIVKVQHNVTSNRWWSGRNRDFLLIMHEKIYVAQKVL